MDLSYFFPFLCPPLLILLLQKKEIFFQFCSTLLDVLRLAQANCAFCGSEGHRGGRSKQNVSHTKPAA
jgi:hypothetical protein